jgi:DNA-binding MarR family transcriptional regulator
MASSPKISKKQYETLAAFRYALRQFLHFSEGAADSAGLTPQQHQALLAIKGFPGRDGITIGELSEQLQVRPHSAVGLVDRLVTERLVAREPSKEDRRRVYIHLTARGENVLGKLAVAHRAQLRRIAPELEALLKLLGPAKAEGKRKS